MGFNVCFAMFRLISSAIYTCTKGGDKIASAEK